MLRFITGATVLGFLAIVGWTILQQYIPGNADLSEVRQRVTGPLTAQMEAKDFKFGAPVFIRIFKEERKLEVWLKKGETFDRFRTYDICAYSGELGPKLKEGDEFVAEDLGEDTIILKKINLRALLEDAIEKAKSIDLDKLEREIEDESNELARQKFKVSSR